MASRKLILIQCIEQDIQDLHDTVEAIHALEKMHKRTDVQERRLQEMKRITEAIKTVYQWQDSQKKQMIQLRYWSRDVKNWEAVAAHLFVGRSTVYRWRYELVNDIAKQIGWSL